MRALIILLLTITSAQLAAAQPLLLQKPTINANSIVFQFAGDLWRVPRAGGDAIRLTAGAGLERDPVFSPDGSQVAFTGEYDGNTDVFVVPAAGGVPKRLTYHPGSDEVVGWTPDGKRILFRSGRHSYNVFARLYTVGLNGGMSEPLPLPTAVDGSFSPDGKRLAYVPNLQWQPAWKRYRGGQTTPIWIADLADSKVQKVPRDNSNDSRPMWVGNRIYFLSDRDGPVTLYAYDTAGRRVTRLLKNDGLDLKAASPGPNAIVYEQFGAIHLYDTQKGTSTPVPIRIAADLPEVRPRFIKLAKYLHNGRLSPTGARAVFEARGEIVTVPAEKGDARNLTNSPGVADRDPAWSPDGSKLAYFSDESGEYALHIRPQNGLGEITKLALGDPPSFFYNPVWSPDGKKIAFADKRLNFWYVDLDKRTPVKIDTNTYDAFQGPVVAAWSPDSKWLAYPFTLRSHIGAIKLYSLETGKSIQITDGMSDARSPIFDKNGKYLYFTASTDAGLTIGTADMTGMQRPVSRSVYLAVLNKEDPSPFAPESDEEKAAADKDKEKEKDKDKPSVRVDLEDIGQRILAVPVPARNYETLAAGKAGNLLLLEGSPLYAEAGPSRYAVHRFDLARRKTDKLVDGILDFAVSENGEKMLIRQGETWTIAGTAGPVQPAPPGVETGPKLLNLADAEIWTDPRAEWNQMYREAWRIERDFLYDPGFHGLNLAAAQQKYAPWMQNLASRADLNYLFEESLGEITLGHTFVGGGDLPETKKVKGGLLGADYRIENGRYRFARVYNGENWNPQARAPLTQPGVNVKAGEYLLAVNGRDVPASEEVYRYFEGAAGKQTTLKVGPNPDGSGAREVTVVPVESEAQLRHLAWIEDNRRKVAELSGGKLAYVYLPDTSNGGFTNFNRYFFSQTDKQGAIIDERFNGGGWLADYIIELMRRPPYNLVATREGIDEFHPVASIQGPKVMIVNEMAGSGGDWLPWTFKRQGIGTLVGKRTWGGLVGIGGFPELIDGGGVTAPRWAIYGLNGEWEVENRGISPDVEVDFDPAAWRQGHDSQLEKAVEVALAELKKNPLPTYKRPAYPNYHPTGPLSNGRK